jgi:5-methyltetrahydrofolate--homocysteine methyltransferase
MTIQERLQNSRLFCDGGTGTILQGYGLTADEKSDVWGITHPDIMVNLHKAYLAAGADILTANTFCSNRISHPETDSYQPDALIQAAISNARQAITETPSDTEHYVALDIGPTGQMIEPYGDLEADEAYDIFAQMVRAGVKAGCDLILIETMIFSNEALCAIKAATECSNLPVFATFSLDLHGRLISGEDITFLAKTAKDYGLSGIGMNCGFGPDKLKPFAKKLLELTDIPVIVNPNAGLPVVKEEGTTYSMDAEHFSDIMVEMADMGVRLMGGCCGTTPEYIQKMTNKIKNNG